MSSNSEALTHLLHHSFGSVMKISDGNSSPSSWGPSFRTMIRKPFWSNPETVNQSFRICDDYSPGNQQFELGIPDPRIPMFLSCIVRILYVMLEFGPRMLKTVKRVVSCGLGCVVLCRVSMDQRQPTGSISWDAQSLGAMLMVLWLATKVLLKVLRLLNLFKTRKKLRIIKLLKLAKYVAFLPIFLSAGLLRLLTPASQAGQTARLRRQAVVGPPPPQASPDAQANEGSSSPCTNIHACTTYQN